MKNIFIGLIWPAAAGNVVWSFFSVAVEENWSEGEVIARLLALLLLAAYLVVNWDRIHDTSDQNWLYWVGDGVHLVTVVVFAIAIQLDKNWLDWALATMLLATAIGHISGIWEENCKYWLAAANGIGLIAVFLSPGLIGVLYPWNLPVAIACTLIAWGIVRWVIIPWTKKKKA